MPRMLSEPFDGFDDGHLPLQGAMSRRYCGVSQLRHAGLGRDFAFGAAASALPPNALATALRDSDYGKPLHVRATVRHSVAIRKRPRNVRKAREFWGVFASR